MKSSCKVLFSFLAFLLLSIEGAFAAAPEITADAAVIYDPAAKVFLYEKNGTKKEYPASMTKIMTAILSFEKATPYDTVKVSRNAADIESTALNGGEWIALGQLRNQMMLISDNGAATAIGETISGNLPRFTDLMNAKAKEIGATHTHFVNANGMPDPDHYSTAEDMAKIAAYAMKNPKFRQLVGTREKQVHYIRPNETVTFGNTNELLYSYPGATGIKTGYTRAAGGCLAGSAIRDGKELIVIVMHSQNTDTRFTEAAKLLDYGFSLEKEGAVKTPVKAPGKKVKKAA